MKRTINQFIWGYQFHFTVSVKSALESALKSLGIDTEPSCTLVGVRLPGVNDPHRVCVEPEEVPFPIGDSLFDRVEKIFEAHPDHDMFYGDEARMREKPDRIRRSSIVEAIREALIDYEDEFDLASFVGYPVPIGNFHVATIVHISKDSLKQEHMLESPPSCNDLRGSRSLYHSVVEIILREAARILDSTDPGRYFGSFRNTDEILREAASKFLYSPLLAIGNDHPTELYRLFNKLSAELYEQQEGNGRLAICSNDVDLVKVQARFDEAVPLREVRWARKVMQMTSRTVAAICDGSDIYGIGSINEYFDFENENAFIVDFLSHNVWELRCGQKTLIRSEYGNPTLPRLAISRSRFIENYLQQFQEADIESAEFVWKVFEQLQSQVHGSMVVVASDAAEEAVRLKKQGTLLEPTRIEPALLASVTKIDGTVLLDTSGQCFAVGVILDGFAVDQCTPSRGSRYNSAIRYVSAAPRQRLAIVVSDDKHVDIMPLYPPRISRRQVEEFVSGLENANGENYYGPLNWLRKHRVYLNEQQCARVNSHLPRLHDITMKKRAIWVMGENFSHNHNLDDRYFLQD